MEKKINIENKEIREMLTNVNLFKDLCYENKCSEDEIRSLTLKFIRKIVLIGNDYSNNYLSEIDIEMIIRTIFESCFDN